MKINNKKLIYIFINITYIILTFFFFFIKYKSYFDNVERFIQDDFEPTEEVIIFSSNLYIY